jgi:hypothetical protein
MLKQNLEKLKKLVAEEKTKNPKKRVYSMAIRNEIASLIGTMSTQDISKSIGVSKAFVDNIKRLTSGKSPATKKSHQDKAIPDLHFLQIPNDIDQVKKLKDDGQKRFMKVTTPTGISIEIWG